MSEMDIQVFVEKHFSGDPEIARKIVAAYGAHHRLQALANDVTARARLTVDGCTGAEIQRIADALQKEGLYKRFEPQAARLVVGEDAQAENIASVALMRLGNPHCNLFELLRAAGREDDHILRGRVYKSKKWLEALEQGAMPKQTENLSGMKLPPGAIRALASIGVITDVAQAVGNPYFNVANLVRAKGCGRTAISLIRQRFEECGIPLPEDGARLELLTRSE